MRVHKRETDGGRTFACPFCRGALSSPGLKVTSGRKAGRDARPVGNYMADWTTEHESCCDGPVHFTAEELNRHQDIPAGTTAHYTAYHGRRQQIENVNSQLKDSFCRADGQYTRVHGLTERHVLLAFSLAGYNRVSSNKWRDRNGDVRDPNEC